MTHENSIRAYDQERHALTGRRFEIWQWMMEQKREMSDRTVMQGMGYSDMNAVRPRLTELVKTGWLLEIGHKLDELTGKRVRILRAVDPSSLTIPAGVENEAEKEDANCALFSGLFDESENTPEDQPDLTRGSV